MSFDLSTLGTYTRENEKELVLSAILTPKTMDLIRKSGNVYTNVATSIQINELDTDAVFQAGGSCGFTPSGTTTVSRRTLTVGAIAVMEDLCPKQLKQKYTQLLMAEGSQPEDFPFEQKYLERKNQKIGKQLEIAIWQGDTASANTSLNKFDGMLKIMDLTYGAKAVSARPGTGTITSTTGSTSVSGTGTAFSTQVQVGDKIFSGSTLVGTVASITNDTTIVLAANGAVAKTAQAFTIVPNDSYTFASPILASAGIVAGNVLVIFDSIYSAIPSDVLDSDGLTIFCGWDVFRTLVLALKNANLYHYDGVKSADSGEIVYPGTNIKVIAVHGLTGTSRIPCFRLPNVYLGTDMNNEEFHYDFSYAKEAKKVRFDVEWKTGVQFAFLNEITQFCGA